jgi:hypothetical protein
MFSVEATLAVAPESRLVTIFMPVVIQGGDKPSPYKKQQYFTERKSIFRRKIVLVLADIEHRKMLQ